MRKSEYLQHHGSAQRGVMRRLITLKISYDQFP